MTPELAYVIFYATLGVAVLGLAGWLTLRVCRNGLLRKELLHFFASPIAWLVMAAFTFVNGYIFMFIATAYSSLGPNEPLAKLLFGNGFFWILQLILLPAITMRLVAEERASGTIEPLMTAPVTDAEVIYAKYLGALIFYFVLWIPTLVHVGIAYWYGVPDNFMELVREVAAKYQLSTPRAFFRELNATMDFGPIASAYLGVFLMGSAWLSLGILTSSLARNQVVAFVLGFVITIMTFAINYVKNEFPTAPEWVQQLLDHISFQVAFEPFPQGIVDTRPVVYFVSLTIVSLFLSVRVLESRKWR